MIHCMFYKQDFVLCSLLYILFKVLKTNIFEDGQIETRSHTCFLNHVLM